MVFIPSSAMGLWGILCFLLFLEKSWGQEQIYIISGPKAFRVGTSENITIQAYGYTEAFDMMISIKSYPDQKFNYSLGSVNLSPENKFQNSVLLTIQPNKLSERQSSVSYVYLEAVSKYFSQLKKMPVTYDNGSLLIDTDKPVYVADASVNVRVYSLDDDLQPVTRATVLTFIDPEGVEVSTAEGRNHTGSVSFPDFKIPSNPKNGLWTIKARYQEDISITGTAYFEVEKYDPPLRPAIYKEFFSPTNNLKYEIQQQVAKYKHQIVKKCCYDGTYYNDDENCDQRAARIKLGPYCVKAFKTCCEIASRHRTIKNIPLLVGH